jgi:DNA-binding transcriptional LysR family regulator
VTRGIDAALKLLRFADGPEIVCSPLEEGPFEWVELLRDPYVLLVAADSPFADREAAPSLRELEQLPLIGWRTDRKHDLPGVEYAFRSDDNGTVLGLVAAGMGVAAVPRLVFDPYHEDVVDLTPGSRVAPRSRSRGTATAHPPRSGSSGPRSYSPELYGGAQAASSARSS